jgi:hypothetical protein
VLGCAFPVMGRVCGWDVHVYVCITMGITGDLSGFGDVHVVVFCVFA